jgi:Sec-independent protein translocase protein TatA
MDIKNDLAKAADAIGDAAKDVRDTVSESAHKTQAAAEHERRTESGETMTTGQKIESSANEVKHNVQAGLDHAKRDVRDAGNT